MEYIENFRNLIFDFRAMIKWNIFIKLEFELNTYLSLCLLMFRYLIQDTIIRFYVNLDYTEINTQRIICIFIEKYKAQTLPVYLIDTFVGHRNVI